jgi:RNA polymerase sigma-70 factor (ECF subfamily)
MEKSGTMQATRSTLLVRLKDLNDQNSWQEFYDTYWTLLYNYARRTGLNEADTEDVVMETIELVARKIEDFEYNRKQGRFKGWLMTIVRNKLGDRLRKQKKQHERGETVALDAQEEIFVEDPRGNDFERLWDEEWEKQLVDMALKRVKRQVSHRQYQIFYCYVIQEQKVDDVAEVLNVSKSQVYVAKNRVGQVYEQELRALASGVL